MNSPEFASSARRERKYQAGSRNCLRRAMQVIIPLGLILALPPTCPGCEPPIDRGTELTVIKDPAQLSEREKKAFYLDIEIDPTKDTQAVLGIRLAKIDHRPKTILTSDGKGLLTLPDCRPASGVSLAEENEKRIRGVYFMHVDVDLRPTKNIQFGAWCECHPVDGYGSCDLEWQVAAERLDGSVPTFSDFFKEAKWNPRINDASVELDEQGRDWAHQTVLLDDKEWDNKSLGSAFGHHCIDGVFCSFCTRVIERPGGEINAVIFSPGLGFRGDDYRTPKLSVLVTTRFKCQSMDEWLQSPDHFLKEGRYLAGKGEFDKAIADYEEAVKRGPKDPLASNGLAWFYATASDSNHRDANKAIELATKACELSDWKGKYCLDTLAAANAEAGKFDEAVKWQTKAIDLTQSKQVGDEMRQRLSLYQSNKPYHQSLQK